MEVYEFDQKTCPDCGSANDGTIGRGTDQVPDGTGRVKNPAHDIFDDQPEWTEGTLYRSVTRLELHCTGCGRYWKTKTLND